MVRPTVSIRIAFVAAVVFGLSQSHADSLFIKMAAANGTLISDQKVRFEVGDLVTVLVRENISATTRADTDTKKESTVESEADVADNKFLTSNLLSEAALPNWDIEAESEFKTSGATRRSNTLTFTISSTVTKVLENGNIWIEGTKHLKVNREDTGIRISGLVRARDVTPANTVLSIQIADQTVELIGHGPLWNNQRRGYFTRLFDWFSPF